MRRVDANGLSPISAAPARALPLEHGGFPDVA